MIFSPLLLLAAPLIMPEPYLRVPSVDGHLRLEYWNDWRSKGGKTNRCTISTVPGTKLLWEDLDETNIISAIPLSFGIRSRFGFLITSNGGAGRFFRTRVLIRDGSKIRTVLDVAGESNGENALPNLRQRNGLIEIGIGNLSKGRRRWTNYVWSEAKSSFSKSTTRNIEGTAP